MVDDSRFYRARIEDMLRTDPDIEVVGSAGNGHEAVDLALRLKPDALTMDYEMPGLDGISAIEKILADRPVPILMLSAMSFEGAKTTLKALDAGAADFLPKAADGESLAQGASVLVDKIKGICSNWQSIRPVRIPPVQTGQVKLADPIPTRQPTTVHREKRTKPLIQGAQHATRVGFRSNTRLSRDLRLIVIGASTGGPVAVQKVLDKLPAGFPVPIVTVLHMPASFTQAFAERLDQRSALTVRLAAPDVALEPGCVYVAPGGMQTVFGGGKGNDKANGKKGTINVVQSDPSLPYKPCVDVAFRSAADVFGASVLGIVLTGMGADGREGALALKNAGSSVWVQDAGSCVVYGMPQAVMAADAADAEMAIGQVAERLVEEVRRGRA